MYRISTRNVFRYELQFFCKLISPSSGEIKRDEREIKYGVEYRPRILSTGYSDCIHTNSYAPRRRWIDELHEMQKLGVHRVEDYIFLRKEMNVIWEIFVIL